MSPPRGQAPSDGKRIALVVGGSRGIGRAIALRLARSGFDLWVTYHGNREAAEQVAALVTEVGRECTLLRFDVASFEETREALQARAEERAPDVVVYNSGITRDKLVVWMSEDDWTQVLATNLTGFYNVTRAVLFSMLRARRGRIVAISSLAGQIGNAGQMNYAASKAGLIGAAKALALEVGKRNILVNVVSPGFVETDMTAGLDLANMAQLVPLQRVGTVEDVASVVQFLCCEEHMYIHGQVIAVNGGMST
jgi:3-oxoacyl-[acyl-carrier protein] reductase